jgi:hypothetical protein
MYPEYPKRKTEEKMDGLDPNLLLAKMGDNNGDDKTLWLFLLLMIYGRDGFGGGAGGGTCCPPVTLEQLNDAQNAIQSGQVALSNRIGDQTSNIIRDIGALSNTNSQHAAGIQANIDTASNLNLLGQKDMSAAIAKCCCDNLLAQKDTQAAIAACCCETQNSLNMQTQVLSAQICSDGDKTRALITQNKIDELQAQLTDQKLANSNLHQTVQLSDQIRESCGPKCHPWWGNGGPPYGGGPPATGKAK